MVRSRGGDVGLCTLGAVAETTLGAGAVGVGDGSWGAGTLGRWDWGDIAVMDGEGMSGVSGDASSFHLLKISRRWSMAMSCALMESSVASLMAVERKVIAWRSRSS